MATVSTRLKRRFGRDDGVMVAENAVVIPAIFLLFFLILQIGFYWHASNIATSAAQEGVRDASATKSSSGTNAALSFVNAHGGSMLKNPNAHQSGGARRVSVTVTGKSISMVPGIDFTIEQTATAPIERLTG